MKLPTDREILEAIYKRYYPAFGAFAKEGVDTRSTKVYVPVDLHAIAESFEVDGDIIFGRLYYYLEDKYGYKRDDGSRVHFFAAFEIPGERHCIHFPMLSSVLASLQEEYSRQQWTRWLSIASIFVAGVALGISVWKAFGSTGMV